MAGDQTTTVAGVPQTAIASPASSSEDKETTTSVTSADADVPADPSSEKTVFSGQTASSAPVVSVGQTSVSDQSATLSTQPATTSSSESWSTNLSESSTSMTNSSSQNLVAATAANSSQNANSPSVSSTTNAGALAGGIVGAFFGGVMLALMAAYAFDHRRKSSPYKTRRSKAVESVHGAPTGKSLGPATIVPAWERLIPQPVDDETMTSLVKSLLDRVALHVDNFYSRKSVQISALDLETFARVDSNLLPYPLPEVMIDPKMQLLAIKHCIAFALTNSIMPGDSASNKILPIYLAALPLKLASNSDSEKDTKTIRQAYAVWKTLTFCLIPKLAEEPVLAEHRRQVTQNLVNDISAAFREWEVNPDNGAGPAKNLTEITGVAFDIGMRIASQACAFKFDWKQRRRHGMEETGGVVVLPGFNKLTDERGHAFGGPQVLVRPTAHRMQRDR